MRRVPVLVATIPVVVALFCFSLFSLTAVPISASLQQDVVTTAPEGPVNVSLCAWVVDTTHGTVVNGAPVSLLGLFGASWQTLASGVSDSSGHVLLNYTGEGPDRYALVKTNPSGYHSVSASGTGWTVVSTDRVEAPPGPLGCATFDVVAIEPSATPTATARPSKTPGNTPTSTPTPLLSTMYTLCGWVLTPDGTPLPGWNVRLDWYTGTNWVRPVAATISGADGKFCLTADTHGGPPQFTLVQQPVLPGWTAVDVHPLVAGTVSDGNTVFYFTVGAPGTYNVVEFIRGQNTPTPTPSSPLSKVVGYVYEDLAAPLPIAGVTVRLYEVNGGATPLGTAVTDAFGYFEFEGQYPMGTLAVVEEDLPGWYSTRSLGDARWSSVTVNRLESDGDVPVWGCLYFYDLRQATATATNTPIPTNTYTPEPTSTPTHTPIVEPSATPEAPTATPTPELPGPTATPTPELPGPTATPTSELPEPTATPTPEVPGPTATPTPEEPTPTPTAEEPTATPTPTPEVPVCTDSLDTFDGDLSGWTPLESECGLPFIDAAFGNPAPSLQMNGTTCGTAAIQSTQGFSGVPGQILMVDMQVSGLSDNRNVCAGFFREWGGSASALDWRVLGCISAAEGDTPAQMDVCGLGPYPLTDTDFHRFKFIVLPDSHVECYLDDMTTPKGTSAFTLDEFVNRPIGFAGGEGHVDNVLTTCGEVPTPTATPTFTPGPTATPTNTFTPGPTATPTNTLGPTVTATNTPTPQATGTGQPGQPTATPTVEIPAPTATNTPQGPAPTATNTPQGPVPTATNTPQGPAPTATSTPQPPAPTATWQPPAPTATSQPWTPPSATPAPSALPTPARVPVTGGAPTDGMGWVWGLVSLVALALAAGKYAMGKNAIRE